MAAAHVFHYGVGVPVRKVPAVLRSADWCGAEPGGRSAKTRCDVPGVQWGMPTISCGGFGGVPVHSSTPTTRDGEWTAGLLF